MRHILIICLLSLVFYLQPADAQNAADGNLTELLKRWDALIVEKEPILIDGRATSDEQSTMLKVEPAISWENLLEQWDALFMGTTPVEAKAKLQKSEFDGIETAASHRGQIPQDSPVETLKFSPVKPDKIALENTPGSHSSSPSDEEPLITVIDESGTYILRKSAIQHFHFAQRIAKAKGLGLQITSSHRTLAEQKILWEKAKKRYGSKARLFCAPPTLESPHLSGGAVDIALKGKNMSIKTNQEILSQIMLKAGWAPYPLEYWHWEWGTKRWAKYYGKKPRYTAKVPEEERE